MKIKVFIVTFKNAEALNKNLNSLLNSDLVDHHWEIHIINNHSEFKLKDEYQNKVSIWHNSLRPDFSKGHLSRNWNQAIINGFKSLNQPDCDILVTAQDDVIFMPDCFSKLLDHHQQFSFIQSGVGDALCSYTPESIKKIGLWDERFCNIGSQEADFFLRALIYNKAGSMISDIGHGRVLNNKDHLAKYSRDKKSQFRGEGSFIAVPFHDKDRRIDHSESAQLHPLTHQLFLDKWGVEPAFWTDELIDNPPTISNIRNYLYYPYFEKNVEDLAEKNYLFVDEVLQAGPRRKAKGLLRKIWSRNG